MNKTMEMYSPSHKKKVMAEVIEGYAQNSKGGTPRLALKGLFEGKKTLPKKVDAETFEKYGFNAEQTIAAFHAESVGEPLPESPLEDVPSTVPSPVEPTNANFSAEDSPSPSGPSEEPEPAEATGSEPSNENFSAESAFDKLEDEVAEEYEEKGMSDEEAERIGAAVAYKQGVKKYGKKIMTEAAKKGVSAKSLVKNAEDMWFVPLEEALDKMEEESGQDEIDYEFDDETGFYEMGYEEPISIIINDLMNYHLIEKGQSKPFSNLHEGTVHYYSVGEYDGEGAINFNMKRINQDYPVVEYVFPNRKRNGNNTLYFRPSLVGAFEGESLVEEPAWLPEGDGRALGQQNFGINMSPLHAESQESMILEACGICDNEFNAETLNADGYCGSCCDTRLADFEDEDDWEDECEMCGYKGIQGKDLNMHPEQGGTMCDACYDDYDTYLEEEFDAESKGVSKNAQIALGLTALGVGLALWKSDSIMNIIDGIKKLGE